LHLDFNPRNIESIPVVNPAEASRRGGIDLESR